MAKTIEALVTPALLTWARRRRRLEISDLAVKLGVPQERVASWERGERRPTLKQARQIAKKCYVPFGYLYMERPPVEKMPIADFRTAGRSVPKPSPDLLDLLVSVMGKQQWFRECRESEGAPNLPFVGRFTTGDQATGVADDMRRVLDIDGAKRRAGTRPAFMKNLADSAERAGIMVMRSGVVDNNNSRPLNTDEFRGFAVSDTMAPLVFVNTRDFGGAQIFTLVHELAHVWTGGSGVSPPDYGPELPKNSAERFCNRVAAEALAPREDFRSRWSSGNMQLQGRLETLSAHYKVGEMAVLRHALDNGLISDSEYGKQRTRLLGQTNTAKPAGESGGNFYRTLIARNGRLFTEAVMHSGELLRSEAADLLDIKVRNLPNVSKHLSGSRP